jgi:DNA-directed RNA polymerase specialized sigma24 family protein
MRAWGSVADMKNENFSEGVRKTPADAQNEKSSVAEAVAAVREIATEDEVRAQLLALDEDALYRLELRAVGYRRMLPRQDVEELVNETLRRALEGCRKWPKDVPFMAFLFESMRSIAWEFLKRNRREVSDSQIGADNDDEENASYLERRPAEVGDPDDAARLALFADEVERMFSDDDDVMAVIIGRVEGLSAAETRERFELTPHTFEAAQKRLRRGVLAGRLDGWR